MKNHERSPDVHVLFNSFTKRELTQIEHIGELFEYSETDLKHSFYQKSGERSVTAANRAAISQLHAMETARSVLARFSEEQQNAFLIELMPEWLATPFDLEKDLMPTAQEYGIAETPDDLRRIFGLTDTAHTVTLFSYLQVVKNRVYTDNAHLYGYNLDKALLAPTLTRQEYLVIGMLLLHAARPEHDDSPGEFQANNIIPILISQDFGITQKTFLNPLPRVCGTGLSPAEKRKEAIRAMQLAAVIAAWSNDIWDILGNPDDPRHDIARSVFERYDQISDNSLRGALYNRVFVDEISHRISSVPRIKHLLQTAEDLDDPWYRELAEGIIDIVHTEFPFRLYYMHELQDIFRHVPAWREESLMTADECEAYIRGHQDGFRQVSRITQDGLFYIHLPSNASLRRWGLDPGETQVLMYDSIYPPVGSQATWIIQVKQRMPGENVYTDARCVVALDEFGLFVWADMVDRETDPGSEFEQHVIHILQRATADALESASRQPGMIPDVSFGKQAQIIPSLGGKGPARIEAKNTKRNNSEQLKQNIKAGFGESEGPERTIRFNLQVDGKILRSKGDESVFERAIERYVDGSRHMKVLVSDVRGSQGGRIFELRAGKRYRMLFERVDDTHAVLIDVVLRKDLDTWISNHQ